MQTRSDGGSDRIVAVDMFKVSKHGSTWTVGALVPYASDLLIAEEGQNAASSRVEGLPTREAAYDVVRRCETRMGRWAR
jgi:hypothetical protein